jgi:hypothetical protein
VEEVRSEVVNFVDISLKQFLTLSISRTTPEHPPSVYVYTTRFSRAKPITVDNSRPPARTAAPADLVARPPPALTPRYRVRCRRGTAGPSLPDQALSATCTFAGPP